MEAGHFQLGVITLLLQTLGVGAIAVLMLALLRVARDSFARLWAAAWVSVAIALGSLLVALPSPALQKPLFALYCFGEYLFAFLLYAGCRDYGRRPMTPRRLAEVSVVLAVVALAIGAATPSLDSDAPLSFVPHAFVLSTLLVLALVEVRRFPARSLGRIIGSASLLLLAIDFLLYVPFIVGSIFADVEVPFALLRYSPLRDLVLEIFVGFACVTLILERSRQEIELTNEALRNAHERLEILVQTDPLTNALNRHALYSLRKPDDGRPFLGTIAVLDIDDLKVVNDHYGHAAGDHMIRSVAKAARSVVRPEDLVFRWGGDEFLLILFGLDESTATMRLGSINDRLRNVRFADELDPVDVSVSIGTASFGPWMTVEDGIKEADTKMYLQKRQHHLGRAKNPSLIDC